MPRFRLWTRPLDTVMLALTLIGFLAQGLGLHVVKAYPLNKWFVFGGLAAALVGGLYFLMGIFLKHWGNDGD